MSALPDTPSEYGPLAGMRVLELGHIVAGPTAGLLLAELGAEVVKIEPPGGDQARRMPGSSRGIFPFLNRGKESVVLDLTPDSAQRPVFEHLVRGADVVVMNYAPATVVKLALDHASLSALSPRVVTGYVQGYLPGGPRGELPLLDEMAQMSSGLAYMTGPPGRPLRAGASVVDIGAATYLCLGIVAALLERTRTGVGATVSAGLFETAAFWTGQHVAAFALEGRESEPYPARGINPRFGWAIYDTFETADGGPLFVGVISDRQWRRLARWLGREDWLADETLASNAGRVAARERLLPELARVFRGMRRPELEAALEELELPYAPIRTPGALVDDPQLFAAGSMADVSGDPDRPVPVPRPPLTLRRPLPDGPQPPPELGADTERVLRRYGVPEELLAVALGRDLEAGHAG